MILPSGGTPRFSTGDAPGPGGERMSRGGGPARSAGVICPAAEAGLDREGLSDGFLDEFQDFFGVEGFGEVSHRIPDGQMA